MSGPAPPAKPPGPSLEEIIVAAVTFVLSQVPAASLLTGFRLQLYGPSIYHGYEWFLLIPAAVAVVAIFLVQTVRWGLWVVLVIFLLLAVVVFWTYGSLPADSAWHVINWILSNCVIALFLALLLRLYLFARGLGP